MRINLNRLAENTSQVNSGRSDGGLVYVAVVLLLDKVGELSDGAEQILILTEHGAFGQRAVPIDVHELNMGWSLGDLEQ